MKEKYSPPEAERFHAPEKGLLEKVRDKIAQTVNESRLPNEEYESTVGMYGGKLKIIDGKLVFDMTGLISKVDRAGDAVLRSFDDHVAREPGKISAKKPGWLLRPGTKRYRGTPEEIFENIKQLGLEEYYALHPCGIEIRDPDIFTKGVALQDIFRQDLIGSEKLLGIDRFQALVESTKYLSSLHERAGIGQVLTNDILFTEDKDGRVEEPVLNIPNIVFNEKKKIGEKEKRATDLLDFLMSVSVEEWRRSGNNIESVRKALETVVENYTDKSVVGLVASFVKRGRLTTYGDAELFDLPDNFAKKMRPVMTKHNEARFDSVRGTESVLKKLIMEVCLKEKDVIVVTEEDIVK